jgi:cyclopropane fatty-acyl-phospholipid synthase-like methyltransferase
MAASLGLDATGLDLSATAVRIAERKARNRGLAARFLRHHARDLPGLGEQLGTVLDCGLFHVLGDAGRAAYVTGLEQGDDNENLPSPDRDRPPEQVSRSGLQARQ